MNKDELKLMQNYPLWMKVEKTKQRIREWYEYWDGQVYVSYSGGKDSTVLLHIARQIYPDIPVVFCNTGIEYPEVLACVRKQSNITELRPVKPFHKIIKEYGYPVISKEISHKVGIVQRNGWDCKVAQYFEDDCKYVKFKCAKYAYLVDAPFKIDSKCCHYLKEKPVQNYEKETGNHPILATMACESVRRTKAYLQNGGCNAFNNKRPVSTPMGFWTENDVFQYIIENNLEIPSVYGDIIKDEYGNYITTGLSRTGCMYCPFGVTQEDYPNRYQRMQYTHPKHYKFMLEKLGFKQVFDYAGIEYEDKQRKLF